MLGIIKKLAISHRYIGTENEKSVQNFIIKHIKKIKYKITLEKINYIKSETYFKISKLISLWLFWFIIFISVYINVLISIFLFFSYIFIKRTLYSKIEDKIAKNKTFNIITTKNPNKKNRLIICCHYDSSKVMNNKIRKIVNKTLIFLPLFKLIFYFYILFLIFNIFVNDILMIKYILWLVLSLTTFIGVSVLSYCILKLYENKYSNGADDNASSVVVMLALLNKIKNININFRIDFVFFGAEEIGLFGSKDWLEKHFNELDKEKTYILNLDCIGRGRNFFINKGIGYLLKKRSNEKLNKIITNCCRELGYSLHYYWGGYGDQVPFLEKKLNICSLSRFDIKKLDLLNKIFRKIFFIPLNTNTLPSLDWVHTNMDNSTFIKEKYLKEDIKLLLNIIYSFNRMSRKNENYN